MNARRLLIAMCACAVALVPVTRASAVTRAAHAGPRRILLIGDSIMDQQGNAAAFELRQAGIDAKTIGIWGSGLLTKDQYDHAKTNVKSGWLALAAHEIATFDPDVVAVYMNHNYWPPHPTDAAGKSIDNLWWPAGQAMIRAQADALITILRARGAQVFFVAPVPVPTVGSADPAVWNPIWHGYAPVLAARHVPVIDSARGIATAAGYRSETAPDCSGTPQRVRPAGDLHLTRFGAGIVGTALASALAQSVGVSLHDNAAPGERTTSLVANPSGHGYWLVGCDGSVYAFDGARHLPGARSRVAGRHGVVAAAATSTGAGMWLITADRSIATVGDATPLLLRAPPGFGTVVDAGATPTGGGLWAVDAHGAIATAGDAHAYGSMAGHRLNGPALGIEPTRDGKGYWIVGSDGGIFSFGAARFFGSMGSVKLNGPVVALAATPDDRGYWLLGSDGGIFSFGDARYHGNGLWLPPGGLYGFVTAAPGPATRIVAAPSGQQGYWTLNDNGRVVSHGAAFGNSGDNNLALFTP